MEGKREETARGASRPGPVSSDELDRMLASILTMPNVGGTVFEHPCYKGHAGKSLKHYFEMVASLYLELEGKPLEELETSSDSFAGSMLDFSRKLEDHLKNDTAKARLLVNAYFAAEVQPPAVIAAFTRCLLAEHGPNVFLDLFDALVKNLEAAFVRDRVACMEIIARFRNEMRGRPEALDMHALSRYNTTVLQADYPSKSYQELREGHESREKTVAAMPVWKAKEVIANLTDRMEKAIEGHFKHFLVLLTRLGSASNNGRYSKKVLTLGHYIRALHLQGTIFLALRNASSHDDKRPLIDTKDGKLAVGFIHRKGGKEVTRFVLPVPAIDTLVQVISWFMHQANLYVTAFLLDKTLEATGTTWDAYRTSLVDRTMARLDPGTAGRAR